VATAIFSPFIALKKSMARNEETLRRSNAEGTKKKLGKKGKLKPAILFKAKLLLLKME
jgi:hypothetical protein